MTDRKTLMQVQAENWRDHGARGEADPAVMEDMGFTPFDKFDDVVDRGKLDTAPLGASGSDDAPGSGDYHLDDPEADAIWQAERRAVGKIVCGDCAQVIPCAHADVGKNGRVITRG